jgi:CheY-like chemotaxis protein
MIDAQNRATPPADRATDLLIADDSVVERLMLEGLVASWGYRVQVAQDGREAWAILQQGNGPRLAVLDWVMPGINGAELCRRARSVTWDIPPYLVLTTARDRAADVVEGLRAGADDYVTKPYETRELRLRLEVGQELLRLRTQQQARNHLEAARETAGAVCHEMNQPLQAIGAWVEWLCLELPVDAPQHEMCREVLTQVDRLRHLGERLGHLSSYRTVDYLSGGARILDLEASSRASQSSPPPVADQESPPWRAATDTPQPR